MSQNPYQPGGEESGARWATNQIQAAERNEEAYRSSRETRAKSWHWLNAVLTFAPAAVAGLFLLLMLFWIIRLFLL